MDQAQEGLTPDTQPVFNGNIQSLLVNIEELESDFIHQLKEKGRSNNTLKNYRTDLECFKGFLREEQGKVDIDQFGLAEIVQYGNFLQAKYNSDNSRRRRVQALRIFFDYLLEKGLVSSNPVRKIPTSPKFVDKPRPSELIHIKSLWVHLMEEEKNGRGLGELLAKRNKVIVLLIYCGGLKVSDLAKLKREHIMLGEVPRVLITGNRKRDPYTIELPGFFNDFFQDYLDSLEKEKSRSDIEFSDVLFNANPYRILSGGLSPRGLEIIFEDFSKRLMIKITPKSLRQSCIFRWLHMNLDEGLLKEWLGVAPSYSLTPYKEILNDHVYSDHFFTGTEPGH